MPGVFPVPGVELTTLLVVSDVERSRSLYVDVLGATLPREYGGTSAVLHPVDRGGEVRAFFRDPDGHLLEISEVT